MHNEQRIIELDTYSVLFGSLTTTAAVAAWQQQYSQILLLTDTNTNTHCAPLFFEKTGLPTDLPQCVIPAGEQYKNIDTCNMIWDAMLQHRLDRKALVLNLGGGVVGDMGGFCAATFKRGIDFIQIPTTLLSATDASVGGKLGVDFQGVKNIIGVFKDPVAVLIDTDFFNTLSDRELLSGFAEVIKHACISQDALWQTVVGIQDLRTADWARIVPDSVEVKAHVVRQDPYEQGLRAVLNFGHTIGHAVESYMLTTDAPITHGEAIAFGMCREGRIAQRKGLYTGITITELEALIQRFYPDIQLDTKLHDHLWSLMQQDKKNIAGSVRMAVPGTSPYSLNAVEIEQQAAF